MILFQNFQLSRKVLLLTISIRALHKFSTKTFIQTIYIIDTDNENTIESANDFQIAIISLEHKSMLSVNFVRKSKQ